MTEEENKTIREMIQNIEKNKKSIPSLSDLLQDSQYWMEIQKMNDEQKEEIKNLIHTYIEEKIETLKKTNGEKLFKRFCENQPELFRKFRELNENDETVQTPEFQEIGHKVEIEMFKLEGILTERMIKQIKGLDQVVSSFYNIVYLFFPRYDAIQ